MSGPCRLWCAAGACLSHTYNMARDQVCGTLGSKSRQEFFFGRGSSQHRGGGIPCHVIESQPVLGDFLSYPGSMITIPVATQNRWKCKNIDFYNVFA